MNYEVILNIPDGWNITYNPKPIPTRDFDYDFVHENYDYCTETGDNGLCGNGKSVEDCLGQIKEIWHELENNIEG